MRLRVASGMSELPLSARETVEVETPAMRAMSIICTRRRPLSVGVRAAGVVSVASVVGGIGGRDGGVRDIVSLFHPMGPCTGRAADTPVPRSSQKNARAWKRRAKLIALKKTVRAGPGPSPAKRVGQNA